MRTDLLSKLPRVDRILAAKELETIRGRVGDLETRDLVRQIVSEFRAGIVEGSSDTAPTEEEVLATVLDRAQAVERLWMRRVVNATGVLLHTNLGRAPLGPDVADAVGRAASSYLSLELDLESAGRGRRGGHLEDALAKFVSAEACLCVNNCAAAVLLVLAAIVRKRAVLISRGELVEIGGGFRIPDVLLESGSALEEVGTTNKTRIADYAEALKRNPNVGAILRVHRSNFRMQGFVEDASNADLARLAAAHQIPFIHDLGGGALADLGVGLAGEPEVSRVLFEGADVVCFSTDKLLGGPQGGVIAGRKPLVEQARRHPLARALRMGKLPMAALEVTVQQYVRGQLPLLFTLARRSVAELASVVEGWRAGLELQGFGPYVASRSSLAEVGGGTHAAQTIPSVALVIEGIDTTGLARTLRSGEPAVLGRLDGGALWLDARAVLPGEGALVLRQLSDSLALFVG